MKNARAHSSLAGVAAPEWEKAGASTFPKGGAAAAKDRLATKVAAAAKDRLATRGAGAITREAGAVIAIEVGSFLSRVASTPMSL